MDGWNNRSILFLFLSLSLHSCLSLKINSSNKNTFRKAVAAIGSHFSDEPGQSQLKTFRKGFTILGAIKNSCDSWEEVKIATLIGVWKKLIPTLMNDFESKTAVDSRVTVDVVEVARELGLELEPGDVTELQQSHNKT